MAAALNFAATPRLAAIAIATANTARDGTGTVPTLITGVAAGTRIERVRITATATVTAGVVRVFLHDGTSFFLIEEVLITATTPSATVKTFVADVMFADFRPLSLPSASWSLRVSTHNAESFTVSAVGADF